jgi:thiol:disulfide interchange protein DsbD
MLIMFMTLIQTVIETLTLGILYGIGPCTISCAPVIIPLIMSTSKNSKEGLFQAFIFGLGRIASYCILGFLSGYLGYYLKDFISPKLVGVFMIILGILIFLKKYPKRCPFANKIKGKHTTFISGMFIGLSPCAPLLGVLSLAILSQSAIQGLLMGLSFGIGTLLSPMLLLGLFAGWWSKRSEKFYGINLLVCSSFLILLGILYLVNS